MGMGIPGSLAGEAYKIVNQTLETGGRGQTQKVTDYSGISDAFMKKASLETQIGGMLMDQNMKRAQMMADADLAKANIHMQSADLQLRDAHFQQARKDAKDADKMSPFEQITGVLAGAAAPAAAGFAVGGPVGAVVGGVAGGAMTMGAGNSRKAQSNIIGNLGTISQAAVSIKGFSNERKAADSSAELAKGINSISGIFRSAAPNSEEFQGAQAQLDNYVNKYTNDQIKAGRPMGEVYKEAAAIKKEAMQGFDPNDSEMVASRNIASKITAAKSDPAFMRGDRDAIKQFQMDVAGEHMALTGKAPTNAEMQIYTGRVDQGAAERFFSGKAVSAMPEAAAEPSIPTSRQASVPSSSKASEKPYRNDFDMHGNKIVPGVAHKQQPFGPGTAPIDFVYNKIPMTAPPSSAAWGVDMDHGPEKMVASATQNFNQAAAKDPTIIDKALNREPTAVVRREAEPVDIEEPSLKEKLLKGADRVLGFGSETGRPKLITGFGTEARRMEAERVERNVAKTALAERKANGPVKIEPIITSKEPQEAQKETVFKSSTDVNELIDEFELSGRYPDKASADAVNAPVQATVGMNRLREYINTPEAQDALSSMTPKQRKLWDNYVQGLGEDAMKGSSKGTAGSALGASVQVNWSEFERSVDVSNEKKGEHHGLTKDQLKTMNKIKTMMTPTSRKIGMAFNTGTLTNQDVAWVPASMINMFDQDTETATAGFSELQSSVWDLFQLNYKAYQTVDDKADYKERTRVKKVVDPSNKPYMFY